MIFVFNQAIGTITRSNSKNQCFQKLAN